MDFMFGGWLGISGILHWLRELLWSKGIPKKFSDRLGNGTDSGVHSDSDIEKQEDRVRERYMINIKKDYSSPNFSVRKTQIDSIIIHHTGGSHPGCCVWLSDPESKVSAHYVIVNLTGVIFQLVEDHGRAWHAGRGAFDVNKDGKISQIERMWNDRSIGIELEAYPPYKYSQIQLHSLDNLVYQLMLKHHISVNMIFGHKEISPGRKFDPAEFEMDDFREHMQGMMIT